MGPISVTVTDANNLTLQVTPVASNTVTVDRGVAGNGIVSIVPVTISTFQYLRITYTNGTVQDVGPLTSTAYTATSPITIVGNTISLSTVPIASGGTGATTAATAIQNLLPSYTGNANKRLGLNSGATALEWVLDGGGTVTSINASGGTTGLTFSGGPITTSGTLTLSGTLAVANGGTSVTTSSGANSVMLRDANQNVAINSITEGFVNVAAAGTTTVLTASSAPNYCVTGSGGQTYQLPDATTLSAGTNYFFNNNQSSGTIVVKNNSSTTVATIQSGGYVEVLLLSNSIAAGSWDVHNYAPSNVSWSTNTFDYPGSITSATWNGTTVQLNRGGTGQTTAQAAMNSFAGAVTSGSYLRGNGTNVVMSTIQAADVPTLNQNTTGTAANITATSNSTLTTLSALSLPGSQVTGNISGNAGNVTGTVAIANGGTGQTTANAAFNALAPTQTGNSGKYLTTDGSNTSWATNPLGTVTSVAATVPSFLSISGSPITTSGTLAFGLSGTALPTTSGGTGLTSFTANGVVYASSTSALATGSALTFDGTTFKVNGSQRLQATSTGSTSNGYQLDAGAQQHFWYLSDNTTSAFEIGSGAGQWKWSNSGGELMRLTSTGLGIGTSSPAAKLQISSGSGGDTTGLRITRTDSGGGDWRIWSTATVNSEGAGKLVFGTSSNLMMLDGSGNLGLGVTPSAWSYFKAVQVGVGSLVAPTNASNTVVYNNAYYNGTSELYITSNAASQYQQLDGKHLWKIAPSGTAGNAITFTQAMTLTSAGNLGLGTTSPSAISNYVAMTINGTTGSFTDYAQSGTVYMRIGADSSSAFISDGGAGSAIRFLTSGSERARITSSGLFNLSGSGSNTGSTGWAGVQTDPVGTIGISRNGSNALAFFHTSNANGLSGTPVGTVSITTVATLYNTTSDQRLKENIVDAPEFGSVIDSIKVRSYDWKSNGSHQRAGFIAQELVTVAPEAVHQPVNEEDMMAVDYSKLVPMLVKEIQSLRKRLADAGIA